MPRIKSDTSGAPTPPPTPSNNGRIGGVKTPTNTTGRIGGVKTPTSTPGRIISPTTTGSNLKLSSDDILSVFQGITERGAPFAAKEAAKADAEWKKTFWASDAWKGTLNFGQSVINTISTPVYYNLGVGYQLMTDKRFEEINKTYNWSKEKIEAYNKKLIAEGKDPLPLGKGDVLGQLGETFKYVGRAGDAGLKNAFAWTRNEKAITGTDIARAGGPEMGLEGAGKVPLNITGDNIIAQMFLQGQPINTEISLGELSLDIALDPLTRTPAVLTKVLGAAKTSAQAGVGAAKIALGSGQVSKSIVLADMVKAAAAKGKKLSQKQLDKVATQKLKASADTFTQYTSKPLLKQDLQRGEVFTGLKNKIDSKYTYETAWGDATLRNVVASSFEAAQKAFMTRLSTKFAKKDIERELSYERKVAKQELKASERMANAAEQVGRVTADDGTSETPTAPVPDATQTTPVPDATPTAVIQGKPKTLTPNEMHVNGRTVYVMDENKIVHQFASQKSAKTFIQQQTNPPAVIKAPVRIDKPIIDSDPAPFLKEKALTTRSADKGIQETQKVLKTVDGILKKTVGVTQGREMVERVQAILREATAVRSTVKNLDARLKLAIKTVVNKENNPFTALNNWASGNLGKDYVQVAAEIAQKTVLLGDGRTVQVGSLLVSKKPFKDYSADVRKQIIAHFDDFLSAGAANDATFLARLVPLVGKEMAERIAATGIFSSKKVDNNALKQIMDELPKLGTEKKYADIDELAMGLKNGDIIDTSVITAILKAIDPEAKLVKNIEDILTSDNVYAQLKGLFIGKGVRSIKTMQRRLELTNPENIMTAKGLAFPETSAAYLKARENGITIVPPAVQEATRTAAIDNLTRYLGSPDDKMRDFITIVLRSVARGYDSSFEYFDKIRQSPDFFTGVTKSGDVAVRNTEEVYQAETRAMLIKQLNQSGEARMLGQLMGLIRTRHSSTKVGKTRVSKNADQVEMLQDFILATKMMEDALVAVLGARNIYAKQAEKGAQHFIYFTMGDFATIMTKMGKTQQGLAAKALFADLAGVPESKISTANKTTLSTIGIGEAVRIALEQLDTTGQIVRKDLVEALTSRATTQTKLSKAKTAENLALAEKIADEIVKPKFLDEAKNVHNLKASATTEDFINVADTLTMDMFTTMFEGWKINKFMGTDNAGARAQLARDWFNKFAYHSGIFQQQGSAQAQAVFHAAANIFMQDGKLQKLANETEAQWLLGSPSKNASEEANKLFADTMELINTIYKHENADIVVGPGRERLPVPTERSVGAATARFTEAKLKFETLIAERATLTTKTAVTNWNKRFAAATVRLDKARQKAWENSIPTQHWDGDQWVPTEQFDFAAATARANETANLLTPEGVARTTPTVDTAPVIPNHKVLTATESKKWIAQWRKANNVRNVERAQGIIKDANERIVSKLDEIEQSMDAEGMNPFEKIEALIDMQHSLSMSEATHIVEDLPITTLHAPASYADAKSVGSFVRSGAAGAKDVATPTPMGRMDVSQQRPDVAAMQARAESTMQMQRSSAARIMLNLHRKYINKLTPEEFAKVFQAAISKTGDLSKMSPDAADLTIRLRNVIETVFGTPETGRLVADGIDPYMMKRAFEKEGLSNVEGSIDPSTFNAKELANYLLTAPFAKMPSYIKKGSDGEKAWKLRAKEFADQGENPFTYITKVLSAVQYATTMTHMVNEFAARFGWKNDYSSMNDAIKNGLVAIKGEGGAAGIDLSKILPEPADGGLFPPNVAEQFMSMNREIERLFYGGGIENVKLNNFIRGALEIQDYIKAMQTILRLGHHMVNVGQEHINALLRGTTDPRDWLRAMRMGMTFMGDDLKTKFLGGKLDKDYENLVRAHGGPKTKSSKNAGNDANTATVVIKSGGKAKAVRITLEDLLERLKQSGTVVNNMHVSDFQMLGNSVLTETKTVLGAEATIKQKMAAWAREGAQWVEKYPGSAASWYSNIPRIATALDVIESRSWRSVEEALDAAFAEVSKYHPTIQSLSATERKFVRPGFMYYTWLRGAHNATIDLLINHAAAATLPSKIQYNQAQQQGQEPLNFGNLWSPNNDVPSYIDYSVYGPTMGLYGQPMVYKTSFMLQDVLDTYKLSYDPAYNLGENLLRQGGTYDTLANLLSSSSNVSLKPFLGVAGGNVDPSTGKANPVKDFESFADATMTNIGFWNLYKANGGLTFTQQKEKNLLIARGYDPAIAEKAVGFTDIEKTNFLQNWLYGRRGQIIYSEANIRNAKTENADRLKAIERQALLGRTE